MIFKSEDYGQDYYFPTKKQFWRAYLTNPHKLYPCKVIYSWYFSKYRNMKKENDAFLRFLL